MKQTESIKINAGNLMPIIKKWLYSDKDIFIRELIANGCDAITKHRKLVAIGEADYDETPYAVTVTIDPEAKQLRFADNGIGMTREEVCKYIGEVALSGATDFMQKYEQAGDGAIIGHFGLGFYSAFMVAGRVTVDSLSYQPGAEAVRWSSDGVAEYTVEPSDKSGRGTVITLDVDGDNLEFLTTEQVRETIEKYCGFLPVPIYLVDLGKKDEKKETCACGHDHGEGECSCGLDHGEGECACEHDHEEGECACHKEEKPLPLNDTAPLWLKAAADCTDEEYRAFYRKMFKTWEDPLFWIHLNVDYPFHLKGILYFPKLNSNFASMEGEIKLYNNQVFVAENIKEVIPEFLMLLKGVIDCPDLPLNVSRSFLQNDGTVKKLSAHITKKVADKLCGLFNTERETYQKYWDDIAPFVKFGAMRDQKFYEQVKKAILYKTTDGRYLTLEEYKTANADKADKKVYYTNDPKRQAASVALYTNRGIDVVVMDHIIDGNFQSFMEYSGGEEGLTFARVDADVSGLLEDSEEGKELNQETIQAMFRKALGKDDLPVNLQSLSDAELPAMVTEDEQIRRMKEMSRLYGQSFDMPDRFTLVLNRRNKAIQELAARDPDNETTQLLCQQIYDLARMSAQPLEADEITAFLKRSQKLVAMAVEKE